MPLYLNFVTSIFFTMNLIDLHTHTTASDGRKKPSDLVDYACEQGVAVMALTDHDTVAGVAPALERARGRNLRLIPGVEFSIDFASGTFHMVGLNIDHADVELVAVTRDLAMKRDTRALRMVEDLARHGLDITAEEVIAEAAGGVTGKPHIARVLVRKGYVTSFDAVFKNYLEKGLPGYVPKEKISCARALEVIRGAGGVSVLAHPASLNLDGADAYGRFIAELKENGLAGIEVFADMHSPEDVSLFSGLARKHSLFMSGGSDYHGDRDEKLGHYNGKVIPFEIYDSLKEIL